MRKDPKCYYARFRGHDSKKFRFETLIYLEDPREELSEPIGRCVAAVVCINPGSAREMYPDRSDVWAPIHKDNTLTAVRNIFLGAYGNDVPPGAFVRVWNLFYLCGKDPKEARRSIIQVGVQSTLPCPSEGGLSGAVWFAWGGPDSKLDLLKKRFQKLSFDHAFFFDTKRREIVKEIPLETDFAKHPNHALSGQTVALTEHLKSILERTRG